MTRSINCGGAVLLVLMMAKVGAVSANETYTIVDTGQLDCYDAAGEMTCPAQGSAFFGQDAQHEGSQPTYIDNGDGTVTDVNTGLMWQQGFAEYKLTYAEAQDYLETMNAQRFAGYSDWRLPTIKQLYSLIDFNGTDPNVESTSSAGLTPFIDTDFFEFAYGDIGAGERIIDSQWVTTSLYVADPSMMFGVNFADGRIKSYPIGGMGPGGIEKTYYVRLCRGNESYGENSFADNGDGTVSDSATGLMWAQSDSGAGMNWEDGLAWAEQMNAQDYLGYDDWRVPNAKELHSLLDLTRSPDTTSSPAISPVFESSRITNEYGATDYPFYWSSTTFLRSTGSASAAVYIAFGRGLGYMNNQFVDIHGAGCQRSDPKDGSEADFPQWGHGPQGDIQRVFNHVRLVRDDEGIDTSDLSFSYWVEIAANLSGKYGSRWRTDLAIRNASASEAEISLVLHVDGTEHSLSSFVSGSSQAIFEDVVALLGVNGKGALEIQSDQPLDAVARIYNQDEDGTQGQFVDACTSEEGLNAGESAWLLGLRQLGDTYRTNISVTNTGPAPAVVDVELYSTDGSLLAGYELSVEPSTVVQDLEPFSARAGQANLGWGFARVSVVSGSGMLSSATVIDSRTNDATSIAMKR